MDNRLIMLSCKVLGATKLISYGVLWKLNYPSMDKYDIVSYTVIAYKEKMKTIKAKELIKKRGSIVEHPFGTIKRHLGWDYFLVRGIEKVSGENALIMFSYNFRRLFIS